MKADLAVASEPRPCVSVEPLFRDRVPEAAARQLAVVLAWLTECQLATLEGLEERKSTSRSELRRQREICDTAVFHCADLNIEPRGLLGRDCSRLRERLTLSHAAAQREAAQPNDPSEAGA